MNSAETYILAGKDKGKNERRRKKVKGKKKAGGQGSWGVRVRGGKKGRGGKERKGKKKAGEQCTGDGGRRRKQQEAIEVEVGKDRKVKNMRFYKSV